MLYFESQDPLNLRHNENVRKAEERRDQDDEDVSIEVGGEAGTKSKHRSAKAKAIRELEEIHVFLVDEDNYDDSLAKQRQYSVVDSMLPTRTSIRKRVASSLLCNEDYVLYDSDKKRKRNMTPSESTNDSKDTKNTKSVGDITTGRKPAYLGWINFVSSSRVLKPKKLDKGPRP